MPYYRISINVSTFRVYEIEANSWEEAKRIAIIDMNEGDAVAKGPPEAVKKFNNRSKNRYVDQYLCSKYATLNRGVCGYTTLYGQPYSEIDAWYFSDNPRVHLNKKGEEFTEWARSR